MQLIPSKTPKVIKQLFPNYIWDLSANGKKKLYLTFDDGPIPSITEFVLEQLNQYNAKATFFCIGDNIQKHPKIFNQILSEKHAIGNHTMNHLKAWKNNLDTYIKNTLDCQSVIQEHSSDRNTQQLFRPPYGQISRTKFNELEKLGYKIILWDVLSKDWVQDILPKKCTQNVIQNTEQGSIIVFHDSQKASKNLTLALPEVLDYFTKQGFVFDAIKL
ncbi:polysaccharide deacetylase family protein [Aquimarina sediminis]|uniref:polysaccharide deacetylase family protein n=1 Tax=Aquimarina sediminis TaxID=2070536 RepID=UPI000CA02BD0|nr:polysaccharide deacetylase family protein [Aquimarina sediminis]